ncbi:MAG: DUF420 domain-containing protein [Proteobacteria bacterium]|nr:DUF420 domain-containing protein [Pseudomonadota bacterium]
MQESNHFVSYLPHLNAILNTLSATMLGSGYYFIRKRKLIAHKNCMIAALLFSAAFLVSYTLYHLQVGKTPFLGTGIVRPVYFTILSTHVVLAITNLVLVSTVTIYAARKKIGEHLSLARWTLIIWAYVSLTGLIIYFMVFHIYTG